MKYVIREMKPSEYSLLDDFLYDAIFQREDEELVPKTIIKKPELQVYISDFGKKKDDFCLIAEAEEKPIGAVWTRVISGYGHLDERTPEFAISVWKKYRGMGIGTELMRKMCDLLKKKGYKKASLAVQKDNYSFKLYQKVGFNIVKENQQEFIMAKELNEENK